MRALLFAIAAAVLLGARAQGQNLVTNGSFDTDLAGWTNVTSFGTATWNVLDAGGSLASGSALLENTAASAGLIYGIRGPCIALPPDPAVNYGGRFRVPSGQARTGSALVVVAWYADAACATLPLTASGTPPVSGFDAWTATAVTGEPRVPGANGVRVEVRVTKTEATGAFQAYADDVYLTTPVTLSRFEAE